MTSHYGVKFIPVHMRRGPKTILSRQYYQSAIVRHELKLSNYSYSLSCFTN